MPRIYRLKLLVNVHVHVLIRVKKPSLSSRLRVLYHVLFARLPAGVRGQSHSLNRLLPRSPEPGQFSLFVMRPKCRPHTRGMIVWSTIFTHQGTHSLSSVLSEGAALNGHTGYRSVTLPITHTACSIRRTVPTEERVLKTS